MIKTIMLDLDGTLLPMDQNLFLKSYFKRLAARAMPYGYEPQSLTSAVMKATDAMVENDGTVTNEKRFWEKFSEILGQGIWSVKNEFDDFYSNEFNEVSEATLPNPYAKEAVDLLNQKGYQVALATNPIFPLCATVSRLSWIGLKPQDFAIVTSYETSRYCKPNPNYYKDMLDTLGAKASECLMVGNDVTEDMEAASSVGINVYLVEDTMINRENADTSSYHSGSFKDFLEYVKTLPVLK